MASKFASKNVLQFAVSLFSFFMINDSNFVNNNFIRKPF